MPYLPRLMNTACARHLNPQTQDSFSHKHTFLVDHFPSSSFLSRRGRKCSLSVPVSCGVLRAVLPPLVLCGGSLTALTYLASAFHDEVMPTCVLYCLANSTLCCLLDFCKCMILPVLSPTSAMSVVLLMAAGGSLSTSGIFLGVAQCSGFCVS